MHRIKRYQKIVNNFWSSLKRSRRIIIFLIITLSSLAPVRGQLFPVTATVNVTTPALPTYLHQWYQSLTLNAPLQINLQFNDLDNAPLNARVQIYLDGPGISIASDPNLPTIVTLEPGQIITLDGAALATLFSVDRLATAGTGQRLAGRAGCVRGWATVIASTDERIRRNAAWEGIAAGSSS